MTNEQDLFLLTEGATSWYLTSGDQPYEYLGNTYIPHPIGRSEIEVKNELSKQSLDVTFGLDDSVARRWLTQVLDTVVTLTVFTKDQDGDVLVSWKGRLSAVQPDVATVKLVFENIFTSLRRAGLKPRFLLNCRYMHYGRGCRLDKADFANSGTVTSIVGATCTVPEALTAGVNFYTGGILEAPDGTLRFITYHSGDQIVLIRPIKSLSDEVFGSGSAAVTIYPGCDRSASTCFTKFNNLANNGSFQFIPTKNPFNGSSFS